MLMQQFQCIIWYYRNAPAVDNNDSIINITNGGLLIPLNVKTK